MSKKKGSKSRGKGARKAAVAVRRGGNKVLSAFGFTKSGFKASNAVIAVGALATVFMPAYTATDTSAIAFITRTTATPTPLSTRISQAVGAMGVVGLGYDIFKGAGGAVSNKGLGGMAVGAGIGMKMAGKFINPLLAGSPVKM